MLKTTTCASSTRRQRLWTSLSHFLFFFLIYCCLLFYLARTTSLDPTSAFFNPARAYEKHYSLDRTKQSEAFIKSAWLRSKTSTTQSFTPKICVGIPSTTHHRARSLKTTIGSLLQGLSKEERDQLHLKVLIAHLDPWSHPAVHEPWLGHTVDEVLFYNETLSPKDIVKIVDLEKSSEFRNEAVREKEVFDFELVLKECFETGAEYVAMLEDDVLAMDGWMHRTLKALEEVEERVAGSYDGEEYLSLNLFSSETSLAHMNSGNRAAHIFWSLFLIGFLAATLYLTRRLAPHSLIGRNVTPLATFWICGIVTPFLLALYFSAGQLALHPLPRSGIVEMHGRGGEQAHSPGVIFPRHQVEELMKWFGEEKRGGSMAELVGEYAESKGLHQWTIVPSVLQHVWRKILEEDDHSEVVEDEQRLWSIAFEQYDAVQLKHEHEEVVREEREGHSRSRLKGR